MQKTIRTKLERLAAGEAPRVVDLFSGCGGLSLGFEAAGFEISGAVEIDLLAAQSHAANFHKAASGDLFERHSRARDIRSTEPSDLVRDLRLGATTLAVDVLVGGPPCQAFARVGRSKLREVFDHPEAFLNDPRSNLYLRYLDYVRALKPLALLMENVPDVLNFGGHNIAEEMCEALEGLGYVTGYTLLNAANYGVPQMRERAFLLAYRRELGKEVAFPRPTHWVEFPPGYHGTRSVALKTVSATADLFAGDFRHMETPPSAPHLRPAVTAKDALADLPPITAHLNGGSRRGARRFDALTPYPDDAPISDFARTMRNWRGHGGKEGVWDHVIRHLPRDYAIFRRMNPGDQYPEAYRHALDLLEEEIGCRRSRGEVFEPEELRRAMVPPYDVGKFPNKWRKMEPDRPARTVMAHIGKDSYTHIHYDSKQARTISVREAARLQSFPDGFRFEGTMNPAFRQIGNAVPPLQARALAREIRKALRASI